MEEDIPPRAVGTGGKKRSQRTCNSDICNPFRKFGARGDVERDGQDVDVNMWWPEFDRERTE